MTLGQRIFEACRRYGLLNDIRGWDRSEGQEEYAGSTWKSFTSGLSAEEKARWERVAKDIAGRAG